MIDPDTGPQPAEQQDALLGDRLAACPCQQQLLAPLHPEQRELEDHCPLDGRLGVRERQHEDPILLLTLVGTLAGEEREANAAAEGCQGLSVQLGTERVIQIFDVGSAAECDACLFKRRECLAIFSQVGYILTITYY